MRKYLIVSHGFFASGIKSSLDIIWGACKNLKVIDAYVQKNQSINDDLHSELEKLDESDELIVFTDLMGGSVTNAAIMELAQQRNVFILAGMNLPLIIDVISAEPSVPTKELIETAIVNAKDQIVDVRKRMLIIDEI